MAEYASSEFIVHPHPPNSIFREMYRRFWLDLICRNAFMDEETEFRGIVFNLDYHEIGYIGD
jgi:hypothetical protein